MCLINFTVIFILVLFVLVVSYTYLLYLFFFFLQFMTTEITLTLTQRQNYDVSAALWYLEIFLHFIACSIFHKTLLIFLKYEMRLL